MADVLLFHHLQGLTPGVIALADDLRAAGHTVHTPDLYDGRTFDSLEAGLAHARETGFDTLRARGMDAAASAPTEGGSVYAGISFGVTVAQRLAQTDPNARGAVLLESCLPTSEFGDGWPDGVPVQVHGKEGDEFFDEDLPAARELVEAAPHGELFLYDGDEHLFTDSSLPSHDPAAAGLVRDRVLTFLGGL